jgi:hypothetical protein
MTCAQPHHSKRWIARRSSIGFCTVRSPGGESGVWGGARSSCRSRASACTTLTWKAPANGRRVWGVVKTGCLIHPVCHPDLGRAQAVRFCAQALCLTSVRPSTSTSHCREHAARPEHQARAGPPRSAAPGLDAPVLYVPSSRSRATLEVSLQRPSHSAPAGRTWLESLCARNACLSWPSSA